MKQGNLRSLVETAILVAVGCVLSLFVIYQAPHGGEVTPLAMLPILLIGLRNGLKWGLLGGFLYALLQMMVRFFAPPVPTAIAVASVVMLDYILAFTVLGLSGLFKGKKYGILYAAPLCLFLRFLCHFFSGIFVWSEAPFAQAFSDGAIWLFSLLYNGSYMGIELILTTVFGFALCKAAPVVMSPIVK